MRPRLRFVVAALVLATKGVSAQTVALQIRPHTGDTLRMRLDQQTEMTGVRRTQTGQSSAMLFTTMHMYSRAIVEGSTNYNTTVLAVTDSVVLSTSDDQVRAAAQQVEAQLRGQRILFRVGTDGTVNMMQTGDSAIRDVAQVVSLMPATFPKDSVNVGDSWSREMLLPASTQLGAQLSGRLRIIFRLDSVVHGGSRAYVSMRGEMQPVTGPGASSGTKLDQGLVTGTMIVDQRRHWLSDSWFNIVVTSTVKAAPPSAAQPMRMQMRITQHMHTFDRRQ